MCYSLCYTEKTIFFNYLSLKKKLAAGQKFRRRIRPSVPNSAIATARHFQIPFQIHVTVWQSKNHYNLPLIHPFVYWQRQLFSIDHSHTYSQSFNRAIQLSHSSGRRVGWDDFVDGQTLQNWRNNDGQIRVRIYLQLSIEPF